MESISRLEEVGEDKKHRSQQLVSLRMLSDPSTFTKRIIHSNVEHIEEIREAGLELPSVNQIEVTTTLLLARGLG